MITTSDFDDIAADNPFLTDEAVGQSSNNKPPENKAIFEKCMQTILTYKA